MGVELATLGAIGSLVGGAAAVMSAFGGQPKQPSVAAPEKPPQAAKAPEVAAVRNKNANAAAGPMSGESGTFLTGKGGVDPNTLLLGKSVLLGE